MYSLDLRGDVFRDKVLGCWIGKNCGGTLGTPVEEAWGRAEPFDIWWYPELQSGGLPNDDLEMQLVWLTALVQVGPDLTARDLARYWLDHIGYNFDEYGLSKANLRLGLEPPVSGIFNNWFTDCMGCPIRSEVWACVAPGNPRIAARYAYEDAICDHAGGESVYGELFNVAIQSAAFVVSDRQQLLDIGLSYVPDGSATQRAVLAARNAHAEGLDWKQARERVLAETPSLIAQYSPINLGFQTIGWLYGDDFGDALCKTVNCGYDTDSSGGSIGSWLGIDAGISQLPQRWIEPFGMGLSTNESWGGVRHLSDGSTPIPSDILGLTDMIIDQAERVLRHHGRAVTGGSIAVDPDDLYADDTVRQLWTRSPWQMLHLGVEISVTIDYCGDAAIAADQTRTLDVLIENPHPDPITVDLGGLAPDNWPGIETQTIDIAPQTVATTEVAITAAGRAHLKQRNTVHLLAQPRGYPAVQSTPIALAGASAWRYRQNDHDTTPGELPDRDQASDQWEEIAVSGNALPLESLPPAALVLQTFIEAENPQQVRLAFDTSYPAQVQLNNQTVINVTAARLIRPSYGTDDAVNTIVDLKSGMNEVLITLPADRPADAAAHFYLSTGDVLRNGIVHLGRTKFPWD